MLLTVYETISYNDSKWLIQIHKTTKLSSLQVSDQTAHQVQVPEFLLFRKCLQLRLGKTDRRRQRPKIKKQTNPHLLLFEPPNDFYLGIRKMDRMAGAQKLTGREKRVLTNRKIAHPELCRTSNVKDDFFCKFRHITVNDRSIYTLFPEQ